MSQQHYEPEFKQQIVRLHIEEGRTYRSLTAEDGASKASICKWCKEFSEGCQQNASKNTTAQNDLELMKENRRLREELADARKENLFQKKSSGILRRGNRLEAYRFIDEHRNLFGVWWLLRRFGIYPNAYYNYRKHRRAKAIARKRDILHQLLTYMTAALLQA